MANFLNEKVEPTTLESFRRLSILAYLNENFMEELPLNKSNEKSVHKQIKRSRMCCFCFRFFQTASKLKQHLQKHIGARPYTCGKCLRVLCRTKFLDAERCLEGKWGENGCPLCEKRFSSLIQLNTHIMEYRSKRCKVCLKKHNYAFSCDSCGEKFDIHIKWFQHVSTAH